MTQCLFRGRFTQRTRRKGGSQRGIRGSVFRFYYPYTTVQFRITTLGKSGAPYAFTPALSFTYFDHSFFPAPIQRRRLVSGTRKFLCQVRLRYLSPLRYFNRLLASKYGFRSLKIYSAISSYPFAFGCIPSADIFFHTSGQEASICSILFDDASVLNILST